MDFYIQTQFITKIYLTDFYDRFKIIFCDYKNTFINLNILMIIYYLMYSLKRKLRS